MYPQERQSTAGNSSSLPNGCRKTDRNAVLTGLYPTHKSTILPAYTPSWMPCSPPFFNIYNLGANKLGHDPFFFYLFFMAPIQLLFTAKFDVF